MVIQIGAAIFLKKNLGIQIGGAPFLEKNEGIQIGGVLFLKKNEGIQIGAAFRKLTKCDISRKMWGIQMTRQDFARGFWYFLDPPNPNTLFLSRI